MCWWYIHATAHVWRSEDNSSLHDEFSSTFTRVLGLIKFRFRFSNKLLQLLSHLAGTLYILKCTLLFTSACHMSGNAVGGSWYKIIWFSDKHDMNFQVATGLVFLNAVTLLLLFFYSAGIEPRTLPILGKHSTTVLRPQCTATMLMNVLWAYSSVSLTTNKA